MFRDQADARAGFHIERNGEILALVDRPEKGLQDLESAPVRGAEARTEQTRLPLGGDRKHGPREVENRDSEDVERAPVERTVATEFDLQKIAGDTPAGRTLGAPARREGSVDDAVALPFALLDIVPEERELRRGRLQRCMPQVTGLIVEVEIDLVGTVEPAWRRQRNVTKRIRLVGRSADPDLVGLQLQQATPDDDMSNGFDGVAPLIVTDLLGIDTDLFFFGRRTSRLELCGLPYSSQKSDEASERCDR